MLVIKQRIVQVKEHKLKNVLQWWTFLSAV